MSAYWITYHWWLVSLCKPRPLIFWFSSGCHRDNSTVIIITITVDNQPQQILKNTPWTSNIPWSLTINVATGLYSNRGACIPWWDVTLAGDLRCALKVFVSCHGHHVPCGHRPVLQNGTTHGYTILCYLAHRAHIISWPVAITLSW